MPNVQWLRRIRNRLKSWRSNRSILRAYGTLHPARVQLGPNSHWIHLDPSDPRARKVLLADPLRRRFRINLRFWWLANEFWQPAVVVDVGLNYGEGLFSARYPGSVRAHGFEANPNLAPFLEQTRAEHPDADRIFLHFGVVSDVENQAVPFHIDTHWSGGSTAGGEARDPSRYQTQMVNSTTVDNALAADYRLIESGTLLFKVDVEGFEERVLSGMSKSLAAARNAVGLVEFSPTLLKSAKTDVARYWAWLAARFDRITFLRRTRLIDVSGRSFVAACATLGTDDPHGDLLLVKADAENRAREFLERLSSQTQFPSPPNKSKP